MPLVAPAYLCDQVEIAREGDHYHVIELSNGKVVGRPVYTGAAMLSLADQAVRAVTGPPRASVSRLPRKGRG